MAARPLSALLVGSAHDVKEHLRPVAAAVVTEDVATSVKSLLECLSGTAYQLRGGCSAWGIPVKKNGKHVSVDALKEALLEKVLSLLPPISFGSLLQHVPENIHGSLAEYKDALVAATDAKRVLQLLMALGPVQHRGQNEFNRICANWKVQVRESRRVRPRADLQAELRGACIRFSPNSVATLWGSYGKGKASGVNRWCALTGPAFLATLSAKSSPRDRKFAFRLRETGPRRGPFRRCVLACAPCRFSEIGKCAKREGFERCAKPS